MSLSKITRGEAVRQFRAAKTYRLVSRRRYDGIALPETPGTVRTIARVTSTGVYIEPGPTWAITRLDEPGTWWSDRKGRIAFDQADETHGMTLTWELDPNPEGVTS